MGDELETIHRAQAGDQAALSALVVKHQTYVYSIALSVLRQPADAADMTQEAFIRLMRSLHTYRGDTKFTTWLYRLVTNICLDELRRRKATVEPYNAGWDDEDDVAAELPDRDRWAQPEQRLELRESAAEVRAAIDQLPSAQRLALTLYYFGELQDREIAAVMELPVNTVKSHIHRGKARLAQVLGPRLGRTAPVQQRPAAAAPTWPVGLGTRVAAARPLLVAAKAA